MFRNTPGIDKVALFKKWNLLHVLMRVTGA